jgi:septin family protein
MTNSTETNSNFEQQVLERLDDLKQSDDQLRQEVERFDEKFENYQKAIQWVVQLAFSLIAAATVTVIVSSVFGK